MGDRVIERREIGKRRRLALVGRIPQMVIEPAMRGFPRGFVGLLQPIAEPLTHERMGVDRFRIARVARCQQPHLAQPGDRAPPLLVAELDERISQPWNRRVGSKSRKALAARRAIEQPDAMEDRLQDRLIGEPFLLIRLITRRAWSCRGLSASAARPRI